MLKVILLILIKAFGDNALAENTLQKIFVEKELNIEELNLLDKGQLITKTREIDNSVWPEITTYAFVASTPLEAMAVFSALDYQKDYVPNLLISKPIKHISPTEVLTEYEMHMPFPVPNAHYVHGSTIHQYKDDYELTWYRVESSSTELVNGSAYFTAYRKGSLFRYKSYIKPKSIFGSFVKNMMLRDVKKTVEIIRDHINKLKSENSAIIMKYSDYITRALKGEFVYKDLIESK